MNGRRKCHLMRDVVFGDQLWISLVFSPFFSHFQPCGLYSDMIYVVILHFFLKLPENLLGAAYSPEFTVLTYIVKVKLDFSP